MKPLLSIAMMLVCALIEAQPVTDRLDALFRSFDGVPYLHGGVLVGEKGRVLYQRAFGATNTVESRFQTASMSKVVTSTAILQLVEKKRLRLDDRVVALLPQFPYEDITVRHLLTHTSGLPDL